MWDFLYSVDLSVFNFINQDLANPFFDKFFPFITNVKNWFIAFFFLWITLLINGGKVGKVAAVMIILLIATSDQISSNFLKNLFERIRPCNALDDVNMLISKTSSYSFPSSHAFNSFAAAVFFYKLYPKLKWLLFITASLLAISRVVVGVHYPSDIVAGTIMGSAIGYIFAYITLLLNKKFSKNNSTTE